MEKQVAAVESNGQDMVEIGSDEPDGPQPQGHRPAKFIYPGGSRPLQGYTIKRGIGHGGFGEIYYALSDAGKEVALKLIRRNLDVELRGIRHCLNLRHPNLLALYDIRQDDEGDTWVVMEYVSGGCLADALAAYPEGMPAEQALAWFHGLAMGVAYLHDRGIVHRDLKPGNIFSDEGLVKVGDYGLSKFISCSRRSGQTESVGTVHYMAPEVANGRYGKEIDIYALGIILYEMVTGRVPFDGESVGEVLMKHLTAQPDLTPLAEPYRSVVARALEKDPAKRFRSVGEMLAALPQPAQAPPGTARLPSGSYAVAGAVGAGAGTGPFAQAAISAEVSDEEPILRAVRENSRKLHTAWNRANLATPVKVIILTLGMLLLLLSSQVLIPVAIFVLVLYGAYRLVRMVVVPSRSSAVQVARPAVSPMPSRELPGAALARDVETPPRYGPAYARTMPGRRGGRHPRPGRERWHPREQAAAELLAKSTQTRVIELVGSLLVGALAALAMCVVMVLLNSYRSNAPTTPEQCAWLAVMGIAGTWAVLIPSKFWEGTRGEAALRRFTLMSIGLGLGVLAFGVATMLLVDLPYDTKFLDSPSYRLPPSFYASDGRPLMMAYLACFGTLFLLMRWWRQADPLRGSRLSLWSLLVTLVAAGLVATAWHFPQLWLVMVAGTVSVSVQLASPWVHPHKRIRRQKT